MKLSLGDIAFRFLFALLLVMLTYNPTGYSYFQWAYDSMHNITPYIVIAGLVLLIGWAVYLKATFSSLGFIGIVLSAAFLGCLVWLFIYWGLLNTTDVSTMAWIVEILLAVLLTLGMSWSHISRRMSGQVDVNEIEEN